MIARQKLADALGRLDPRAREILDYSLRRRVPDTDLASVFSCEVAEVARMRAEAVEGLANDLEVQRGADLGQVLTALLDQATWDLVPGHKTPAEPADPAEPSARPTARGASEPESVEKPQEPESVETPRRPERSAPHSSRAPMPQDASEERGPVLGMLARSEAEEPDGSDAGGGNRQAFWLIAAALLIAVLLAAGGAVVFLLGEDAGGNGAVVFLLGEDAGGNGAAIQNSDARPFTPRQQDIVGDPFPTDPDSASRYPIAAVDRSRVLYDRPGGKALVRISRETDWGSPRVLSVVKREGAWVAVLVPELENGRHGWLSDEEIDRLTTVSWAVKADLSKRTVIVERDGEVIRRMRAGIGRKDHPTPVGRFAVTDKLEVTDKGSPYGCCVLALTGHQPKLPVGWSGGDRLALHATSDLSRLGRRVSLGCMRVHPDKARWLVDSVPLGTPVFISR